MFSMSESLWYPWAHPCKDAEVLGGSVQAGPCTRRDVGMQLPGFDPGIPKQGEPTCSGCGDVQPGVFIQAGF